MMLLLTAIIRGAILVLAGIAEQKGWFTPTQFDPYVNEIVTWIVTALVMSVPIVWHLFEMEYLKVKNIKVGFAQAAGYADDPSEKVNPPAMTQLKPTISPDGFVTPSPSPTISNPPTITKP